MKTLFITLVLAAVMLPCHAQILISLDDFDARAPVNFITNCDKSDVLKSPAKAGDYAESLTYNARLHEYNLVKYGKAYIGRPLGTKRITSQELMDIGIVGIYKRY